MIKRTFSMPSHNQNWYILVAILIVSAGIAIRLLGLNKGIWLDEYRSLEVISSSDFIQELRSYNHPPLYFFLLRIWGKISVAEPFMRFSSVICGVGTIIIMMIWLRRYSYLASVLAGLSAATMPIMLRYSQEIRAYSLILLATCLAFLFASKIVEKPSQKIAYVGLSLSLTVAVASHLVSVMLILTLLCFILLESSYKNINWTKLSLAISLPVATFCFLYFIFMVQARDHSDWWMPPISFDLLWSTSKYVLGVPSLFWPVHFALQKIPSLAVPIDLFIKISIFYLIALLLLFGNWRRSFPLLATSLFYLLQLFIYSLLFTPIFWYRTVLPALIPLIAFLAVQTATIQRNKIKISAIVCLALLSLSFTTSWVTTEAWAAKENWKEISQTLGFLWQTNNMVVFYPSYIEGPVRYYRSELPSELVTSIPIGHDVKQVESQINDWLINSKNKGEQPVLFLIVRSDLLVQKDSDTHQGLLAYIERTFGEQSLFQSFGGLSISKYELESSE